MLTMLIIWVVDFERFFSFLFHIYIYIYIHTLCEFCFYNEHIWFLQWRRVHSWCFWLSRKALNRGRCHCERTPLFAFLGGKENGRSWVDYKWTWLLFLNFLCLQPRVTLSAQKNLKLKTPSQARVGVCAPISTPRMLLCPQWAGIFNHI